MIETKSSPGVYIEEIEIGARPIEGVSTSIAGFLGQTERGPIEPRLVTSFEEYQRIYGGYLDYSYLTYAVEGFFRNGGKRCYIARVVGSEDEMEASLLLDQVIQIEAKNGHLNEDIFISISGDNPGEFNLSVIVPGDPTKNQSFTNLNTKKDDPQNIEKIVNDPTNGSNYVKATVISKEKDGSARPANQLLVHLTKKCGKSNCATMTNATVGTLEINAVGPGIWGNEIEIKLEAGSLKNKLLRKLSVAYGKPQNVVEIFDNFSLDPKSSESYKKRVNGVSNYITLEYKPPEGQTAGEPSTDGDFKPLNGGNELKDGKTPVVELKDYDAQLSKLKAIDGISIICVPNENDLDGLTLSLVNHCDGLMDRFAIISARESLGPDPTIKPNLDSKYAALYYPWISIIDPLTSSPKLIPPCGHVAGVYARVDTERGVHKAPANEILRDAIGLERSISAEHQSTLNPIGINCIRSFPGRGIRIWGARTISSDPSWKYVNVRRLFIYLEKSIEVAIQWAVFEPNDEKLWARVKQTITQFLTRVWRDGALMGSTQDEAFFVRCDRTTMTQDDIDNGKLIVWIGVAPVKPAEFVVFRIAQVAKGSEIIE